MGATTTVAMDPANKKARRRKPKIPPYLKHRILFLHFFGSLMQIHLGLLYGIPVDLIYPATREAKKLKKYQPHPLTTSEQVDIAGVRRALRVTAAMSAPPVPRRSEVLHFPTADDSKVHLDKLLSLINGAHTSLTMCQYVISHNKIVSAIIAAKERISFLHPDRASNSIRIILDYSQLAAARDEVMRLIDASV